MVHPPLRVKDTKRFLEAFFVKLDLAREFGAQMLIVLIARRLGNQPQKLGMGRKRIAAFERGAERFGKGRDVGHGKWNHIA